MRENRTSGLMSGDGKRSDAARPQPPRPSSTLRWAYRSPRPEANSCPGSMTCYDQAAESIAERWVKVGIRVFRQDLQGLQPCRPDPSGESGLISLSDHSDLVGNS